MVPSHAGSAMRLEPTNSQHAQRLHSHAQGQSIHLGPLTWQEAVLLTATVTIALCLLGEYDRRGENQAKQTIVDHSTTVRSILFRPDGAMLLSTKLDGSTMLWDLVHDRRHPFLAEKHGQIHRAAFSPDSKILATVNFDGVVALHNLTTRDSRVLYDPHTIIDRAFCLAFSPDGTTLAIGQQDGRTALWDVSTGRIQQVLSGHTDFIASLVFSPDGMTLASSSADRSVRLWDLPGDHPRFIIHDQTNTVSVLAFSPNGRFLILGNYASPTIQLWDVRTHCERMALKGLKSNLVAVTVSQDSLTLAAADFHGLITFWDLQTLEIVPGGLRDARVFALAFAPEGRTLATGGFDGTIQLWDWPYGSPGNRPQRISATVSPVQVFPVYAMNAQAGTSEAKRPAAAVQAAVSRGS
jgi:WD40 repeat protein